MTKTNAAQLALLAVPADETRPSTRSQRKASASMTARHCRALLAELDRVAERNVFSDQRRAEDLAELFAAAERAHRAVATTKRVARR